MDGPPGAFREVRDGGGEGNGATGPGGDVGNGENGFFLRIWVDDGISVEPDLGYRPYLAVRIYERAVKTLLGESAINREEMTEEGETGRRSSRGG